MFIPSFQNSFFVSQKTSSICTKEWGGSWALGTIYCLKWIKELLHYAFCLQRTSSAFLLSQEPCMSLTLVWTVLHRFESAVLLDIELVSLRYNVIMSPRPFPCPPPPQPTKGGWGGAGACCFWDRSHWRLCKTSLCFVTWITFGIIWWYLVEM